LVERCAERGSRGVKIAQVMDVGFVACSSTALERWRCIESFCFFFGTLCIFDMNIFFPQHLLDLFFFLLPSYYL
jgi:hypothetical protein